jgi:hypothetical protein
MKQFFYLSLITLLILSCKKADYQKVMSDPALFSNTVHELNRVVMGNNFSPVVASRNYAYATVAAYEVMAAGDTAHYRSLSSQLNGLNAVAKLEKDAKIDFHYASILAFCKVGEAVTFPAGSMKQYVADLQTKAVNAGMPDEVLQGSEKFADAMFKSIMKWSKTDNYLKTRSASKYALSDKEGRWVPTPPMYAEAIEPHWSEIRTMVMKDGLQYSVVAPPDFNVKDKNSKYYKEVIAIKSKADSLNPEQIHIADFWDDNPGKLNVNGHLMFIKKKFSPAGHWMGIVGIAAKTTNSDFNTTVCAYAKTGIALFDAFIECWAAKYVYNTVRPETVINKYFDAAWRPHLQTPPFPEYTCGHCTISASAAKALTSVFGDNVAYTDTTELEFGIKSRNFKSFNQAAAETALSRFYGGIHFHNSCVVSSGYGQKIGNEVVNKLVMKR